MALTAEEIQILIRARDEATAALNNVAGGIANVERQATSSRSAIQSLNTGFSGLNSAVGGIVGTIGATLSTAAAVGTAGLVGFGLQSFMAAARASELKVTLEALAKANSLSAPALLAVADGIRKQGIEVGVSRQMVAQFVQNQLDLSKATDLARVAQDAAVVSGMNSTDTYNAMVHGIVTLQPEVIRMAGITINLQQAYMEEARAMGVSAESLTTRQKQQIAMNLVLAEGAKVEGAYLAAMEEPGKVLRSMPRLIDDVAVAFGDRLLPSFGPVIMSFYQLLKSMADLAQEGKPLGEVFGSIGRVMANVVKPLRDAIDGFREWLGALQAEQVQRFTTVLESLSGVLLPLIGFILTNFARSLPIIGQFAGAFNPVVVALGLVAAQSTQMQGVLRELAARIGTFVQSDEFARWGARVIAVINIITDAIGYLADAFLDSLSGVLDVVSTVGQAIYSALQWLNPFASHSPSLVSQVADGVDAIQSSYAKLGSAAGAFDTVRASFESLSQVTADFTTQFGDDMPTRIEKAIAVMGPGARQAFDDMSTSMEGAKSAVGELESQWQEAADALVPFKNAVDSAKDALDAKKDALSDLRSKLEDAKDAYSPLKDQLDAFKKAANDAETAIRDFGNAQLVGTADMEQRISSANLALKSTNLELEKMKQSGAYRALGDQIKQAEDRVKDLQRTETKTTSERETQRKAIDAQRDAIDQLKDRQEALLIPLQRDSEARRTALDSLNLEKDGTIGLAQERVKAAAAFASGGGKEWSESELLGAITTAKSARDAALQSASGIVPQVTAQEQAIASLEREVRNQEKAVADSQKAVDAAQGAYAAHKQTVDELKGAYADAKAELASYDQQVKALIATGEQQVQKLKEQEVAAKAAAKEAATAKAGALGGGAAPGAGQAAEFQAGVGGVVETASKLTTSLDNAKQRMQEFQDQVGGARLEVEAFIAPARRAYETIDAWMAPIGGLTRWLSTAAAAMVVFNLAAGPIGAVLGVVGAAFAVLLSPLALVVTTLGLVGLAFASNLGGIRTLALRTFAPLLPILTNFGLVVQKVFTGDVRGALDTFAAIMGALGINIRPVIDLVGQLVPVFANLGLVIQKALGGDFVGALDTFIATITSAGSLIGGAVGEWAGAFLDWLPTVMPLVVQQLLALGGGLVDTLLQIGTWLANATVQWAGAFLDWLGPRLPAILAMLAGVGTSIVNWVLAQGSKLLAALLTWGKAFVDWLAPRWPAIRDMLGAVLGNLAGWILETAPRFTEWLTRWAAAFLEWIVPLLPGLLRELGGVIVRIRDWIGEQVPVLVGKLGEWAIAFVEWLGPKIPTIIGALAGLLVEIVVWIAQSVVPLVQRLAAWAGAFVGWIGAEVLPRLGAALGQIWDVLSTWVSKQAGRLKDKLLEWGGAFVDWIKDVVPRLPGKFLELDAALIRWILEQDLKIARALLLWAGTFVGWVAAAVVSLPGKLLAIDTAIITWIGQQSDGLRQALVAWGEAFVNWVRDEVLPENKLRAQLKQLRTDIDTWIVEQKQGLADQLRDHWAPAFLEWVSKDVLSKLSGALDQFWNGGPGWEGFSAWFPRTAKSLAYDLGVWAGAFVRWVDESVTNLPSNLKLISDAISTWVTSGDGLAAVAEAGKQLGANLIEGVVSIFLRPLRLLEGLAALVQSAWAWITSGEGKQPIADTGAGMAQGILNGIIAGLTMVGELKTALGNLAKDIWTEFVRGLTSAMPTAGGSERTGGGAVKLDTGEIQVNQRGTTGTMPQSTGNALLRAAGLTYDQIMAYCGPLAAEAIGRAFGKDINIPELTRKAIDQGWTAAAGMGGFFNFQRLLAALDIPSALVTVEDAMRALGAGIPVAISTPLHYFLATGLNAARELIVGESGKAMNGAVEMSLSEIARLGGGIQAFVVPNMQKGSAAVLDFAQDLSTNVEALKSYIVQAALMRGIDPAVALRVAAAETANFTKFLGDAGSSFGPFQLHVGGISDSITGLGNTFQTLTGKSASDPRTWAQQIDFALTQASEHGWAAWHAAAATGISDWQGIGVAAAAGAEQVTASVERIPDAFGPADQALTDMNLTLDGLSGAYVELGESAPGALGATTQAIENLSGQAPVWEQIRKNATETGRDINTYMKDIAALSVDTATASIKQLTQMSGLSFPQVQEYAMAAGMDIRHWLLTIGVPAAKGLEDQLVLTTGSSNKLATDTSGVLKPAIDSAGKAADTSKGLIGGLGTTMGEVATNQATQIAAVLLRLRDGLLGVGDYNGKGLIDAVQQFIDKLNAIPREITVNVHYNNSGGGGGSSGGGGGGGGGGGAAAAAASAQAAAAGGYTATYYETGDNSGTQGTPGNPSGTPTHPGESGPGGIYNDPNTGRPYAKGGIVTSPTLALIGEAGPEAVIPLNGANGWGGGSTTNTTINVTVNGTVVTPTDLVDAIHSGLLKKKRGSGALGLS